MLEHFRSPLTVLDDYVEAQQVHAQRNLDLSEQALRGTQERWQQTLVELAQTKQQLARSEEQLTRYARAIRLTQKVARALRRCSRPFPGTVTLLRALLRRVA